MTKMLAIRIDEKLLARVDEHRRRIPLSRTRVVSEALGLWMERRRIEEAVQQHRDGYQQLPVTDKEFATVLRAQRWPR